MNKHLFTLAFLLVATALAALGVVTVRAQTAPPNTTAPIGNVEAPINVGATTQTKNGSFALKNGILVIDSNTPTSNTGWSMPTTADFAIDTDGPIHSHGILSTADIRTDTSLFALGLASTDPTAPQLRPICGQKSDGKIIPCSGTGGVTATIALNKTTCTGSNCDDIDITWGSTNATSCTVLSGYPEFITGGLPNGSDNDNVALQTTTYTVYCTGALGSATASAKVTVTDAARVVMKMRKVAPLPFTDWTINYANATGAVPFNSCYRNGYIHQNPSQPAVGNKETNTGSQITILTSDNIDKTQYCEIEDGQSWTPNCTGTGLSWGLRMKATAGNQIMLSNMFASGGTNTTCIRVKCKNASNAWVTSNTYMHRNGAFGVAGCGPIN